MKQPFFTDIRVLIWDFDGTLYKPNPELFHAVREAEYRAVMECRGWTRDHAIDEFHSLYKVVTPSATKTVGRICGIPTAQAAVSLERYYDRRKFLARDQMLIDLLKKFSNYQHFILANGVKKNLEKTLEVLGVPIQTFSEIVTSEVSGENKPSEHGFRYILAQTGLPPENHLMIGDREAVDLAPAKKLGMKTCLVWSEVKSEVDDVTVPTVYDISKILEG
ncbi:MAG: HAD family hydrolase [bacterium]|nr:HAD family hydrolase [bacterium]